MSSVVQESIVEGPHKIRWSADFNIWTIAAVVCSIIGSAYVIGGDTRALIMKNQQQDEAIADMRQDIRSQRAEVRGELQEIKAGVLRVEDRLYRIRDEAPKAVKQNNGGN